jgi:DNA repair protein RadC
LKASTADIELTRRLAEAGKLMDINVLDHLIVTPEDGKYLSFADHGMI